jgi:hypothetical protein
MEEVEDLIILRFASYFYGLAYASEIPNAESASPVESTY